MKRLLSIGFVFMSIVCAKAQDPQFSQYYNAPLYLNPGFTGITEQQRFVFNHRIQWPNLPQSFVTYAASYDIWVDELRSGFGIMATTDKQGSAGWRSTNFGLMYSYKVKINDKLVFSPGLYFGYGFNGLDRTKLLFGDQLGFSSTGPTSDPDFKRLGNKQYFDFGSGGVFYTKVLFLGVSFYHMNRPNLSILGSESRLPMKTTINGGARISLYNGPHRRTSSMSYLTPSFIYQAQGSITQLSFGLNYHVDPISIGVLYRGKPYEKVPSSDMPNQDALIFNMGIYLDHFTIGYSYDFSISELSTASGGAHEVALIYEFTAKPLRRGVKKQNRLLPCPTFNTKSSFWK
jgi:type IX secretion system PorP/SprF family membrane protein